MSSRNLLFNSHYVNTTPPSTINLEPVNPPTIKKAERDTAFDKLTKEVDAQYKVDVGGNYQSNEYGYDKAKQVSLQQVSPSTNYNNDNNKSFGFLLCLLFVFIFLYLTKSKDKPKYTFVNSSIETRNESVTDYKKHIKATFILLVPILINIGLFVVGLWVTYKVGKFIFE